MKDLTPVFFRSEMHDERPDPGFFDPGFLPRFFDPGFLTKQEPYKAAA